MFKFKLLRGRHADGSVINPKTGKKTKSHIYQKGDTVESEKRLDQMFGSNKFELLGKAERTAPKQEAVAVAEPDPDDEWEGGEEVESDGLDDMSVRELKTLAKDEGIDLGNASRKSDIVDVIREELADREED